ncbi:MAG: Flp pilus assembly complex ATPase component TadA [Sandaracinaceae bacterium]|nr:Flp pilus assembly complex ATPase component TadA [Sandaracinaceae bacterium]
MGAGAVETLTVPAVGPVVIGRDASCHVVLPSPDVSRRHLTVELNGHGYRLTDASANGTMIGESHLHQATVDAPGGIPMRVGPYVIRLAQLGAPARPMSAPPPAPPRAPPPMSAPLIEHRSAPPPPPPGAPPRAAPPPGYNRPAPPQAYPAIQEEPAPRRRSRPPKPPPGSSPYDVSGTADVTVAARKRIHRMLLDHLDLASLDRNKMGDAAMRPKVRQALVLIMKQVGGDLPTTTNTAQLIDEITNEALGLGPLEVLLADDTVSEIMVVDPETIFVERHGQIVPTALRFTDDEAVRAVIERIITPLGRRIDESTPLVDARLSDGSRVNAIIKPLAIKGSCITIRKFAKVPLKMDDLIRYGSLSAPMAKFIERCVKSRKNIIISGGTGSGKTTLLNVLSGQIPDNERVVTVEDAAELQLVQPHVVSLESKPPNMEGKGAYSIRDLVKNALRMRPDRIVVGECRGGEALDMLQAMNTGHEGSMTTTHANSPPEAVGRIETLALMSGLDLPARAIREQIAQSIDVIIQQTRFSDGSRRITAISEVVGLGDDEEVELHDIFAYHRTGLGEGGKILGEYRATGYLPTFLDEFIAQGLITDGDFI